MAMQPALTAGGIRSRHGDQGQANIAITRYVLKPCPDKRRKSGHAGRFESGSKMTWLERPVLAEQGVPALPDARLSRAGLESARRGHADLWPLRAGMRQPAGVV
jgi:hypothetical protein